ncbi:MAG: glycosyltransferase [Chloroflexota bacterium]
MSGRIAYAVSRFPLVTETFVLREMLELERRGWPIDLYSIIHEGRQLVHPEARSFEARGHYLRTVHPATLAANVRAVMAQPRQYLSLLQRTVRGNLPSPGFLLRGLAIYPGTVALAEQMKAARVQHVHAHFGTHAALMAMIAAGLNGIGYSFTVHAVDLYVDTTMLAEKVRGARFVATISDFNRALLVDLAGADVASKIHVVRCGVDTDLYAPSQQSRKTDRLEILAVGSLRDYKGHDHLIRACGLLRQSHPEIEFTCEITGEGPLRPVLEKLVVDLDLTNHVFLRGARNQQQVLEGMARADVLVMPSVIANNGLMEGIPVTLMEALAVGLPSIATRISGIPELIRDGDTGLLVPPADPSALRDALVNVFRNYPAALERAIHGRALVEQEYSLPHNVARLESLFQDVLAHSLEVSAA